MTMPVMTASMSWEEWHLTDAAAMDGCAEDLDGKGYPSTVNRTGGGTDQHGNVQPRRLVVNIDNNQDGLPDVIATLGDYVVLVAGTLQKMTAAQHTEWMG